MNSRGFTLVELIVVISIVVILSTIATLSWNTMVMKSAVEGQIKAVHAEMMSVRLEALYSKRNRSVVISGNDFKIYSSAVIAGTPVSSRTFKYGFKHNLGSSNSITFDTSGMANTDQGTVCVNAFNETTLFKTTDAAVDSLVISQARINLGKRPEGGTCDTSGVTQK
jgi:prepilin-type N-terminal cleavage/methylation domain-containing protein